MFNFVISAVNTVLPGSVKKKLVSDIAGKVLFGLFKKHNGVERLIGVEVGKFLVNASPKNMSTELDNKIEDFVAGILKEAAEYLEKAH